MFELINEKYAQSGNFNNTDHVLFHADKFNCFCRF